MAEEKKSLFDNSSSKEAGALETLRSLDEKIAQAIEKIRSLKEEKAALQRRVQELEALLDERNQELERLRSEKSIVKGQIEELLSELETLEP
jgi:chromosome segregation ATPase